MLADMVKDLVKEISADSLLSLLGLSSKDMKNDLKDISTKADPTKNLYSRSKSRVNGLGPNPKFKSTMPVNVWEALSKKIDIAKDMLGEAVMIEMYLKEHSLVPEKKLISPIYELSPGKKSAYDILKLRSVRSYLALRTPETIALIKERGISQKDALALLAIAGGFPENITTAADYITKFSKALELDSLVDKVKTISSADILSDLSQKMSDEDLLQFL